MKIELTDQERVFLEQLLVAHLATLPNKSVSERLANAPIDKLIHKMQYGWGGYVYLTREERDDEPFPNWVNEM